MRRIFTGVPVKYFADAAGQRREAAHMLWKTISGAAFGAVAALYFEDPVVMAWSLLGACAVMELATRWFWSS